MDVFSEGGEAIVIYLCLFTYTAASIAEEERKGKETAESIIQYNTKGRKTKDENLLGLGLGFTFQMYNR